MQRPRCPRCCQRGGPAVTRALILTASLAAVLSLLSLTPGNHDLAAALAVVVPVALVVGWWVR